MAVEWCQPCKSRGRLSIARHDVKCTLMCEECFRDRPANGIAVPLAQMRLAAMKKVSADVNRGEETKMPKRVEVDEATRAAILRDAANGDSVERIRKARGIGWTTVKAIVDGHVSSGEKTAGPKQIGRPRKIAASSTTAVVVAEPVAAVTVTPAKADTPDNRVRFILLDAHISGSGLAELTKSVVEALKK